MDVASFKRLLSPAGQEVLQAAISLSPRESDFLIHYQSLPINLKSTKRSMLYFEPYLDGRPGRYIIQVTASDSTISVSSIFIIWIDAVAVTDIGYLLDEDSDGIYDTFYNEQTKKISAVAMEHGVYLIDVNGDSYWDYEYNVTNGMLLLILPQTSSMNAATLPLMLISIAIIIVLVFLVVIVYIKRFHKKQ